MAHDDTAPRGNGGPPATSRSLPIALLRAREAVMGNFRPMLADFDVTEQQWRVMRVLSEAGRLDASDLAARAKDNKLTLEELSGGTFSISNGGIYGNLLSTPIVNAPQSAILGLHAIQDRAVVVDGQIVVRPMMYIAMSYDHRLIDGREAVTFLRRIKSGVEDPTRILLEI